VASPVACIHPDELLVVDPEGDRICCCCGQALAESDPEARRLRLLAKAEPEVLSSLAEDIERIKRRRHARRRPEV
jgi:hypothetical protein